jgi:hypothetical protein
MPVAGTPTSRPPRKNTIRATWEQFEARLQSVIDAVEDGDILIVGRQDANVFVQVLRHGNALDAEAASNQFIDPPTHLLDERHFNVAVSLGWLPPTQTAHDAIGKEADDEPYDGSPNFYRQFPVRTPHLARLFVLTLRRVYGVRTPRALQYASFKREGRIEIRWPTLGIARHEHRRPDDEAHAQPEEEW